MPYKEKIHSIYKITNIINNKIYIGSAIDTYNRFSKHKSQLNKNKHHNSYLQNSWNKYGEQNFKFEIIEYITDKNKLIEFINDGYIKPFLIEEKNILDTILKNITYKDPNGTMYKLINKDK